MKLFTYLLVIFSFSIQAEEICVTKNDLQTAFMFKELDAENKVHIRHNLDKIELIKVFIEDLNEQGTSEQYEVYDEIISYYFSAIVGVIDYSEQRGVKVERYNSRLSGSLKWISENEQYFLKTTKSEEYKRLNSEIEKEP